MGDPVTTGMLIGAAGGALTSKNPIQGAMMGGALGAAGGSFAGGASSVAGTGGGFAGGGYGSVGTAPTFMDRVGAGFSSIGSDIGAANKWMNQNPITTQIGMQAVGGAFAPEQPMQYAQPGQIQRGQPQQVDYMSLLNPQQQTVARPQPFSLI
jgi:hypothetical protein